MVLGLRAPMKQSCFVLRRIIRRSVEALGGQKLDNVVKVPKADHVP
jgi:hypothetical protein